MSGYTPLFASLTTGTLCGKWPDVGLWPIILSLADRHGEVDVTGLPRHRHWSFGYRNFRMYATFLRK